MIVKYLVVVDSRGDLAKMVIRAHPISISPLIVMKLPDVLAVTTGVKQQVRLIVVEGGVLFGGIHTMLDALVEAINPNAVLVVVTDDAAQTKQLTGRHGIDYVRSYAKLPMLLRSLW